MSLINDALKRASKSHRDRPHQAVTTAQMEPAVGGQRSPMLWVLAGGVVVALALAAWAFSRWWSAAHAPPPPQPGKIMIVKAAPAQTPPQALSAAATKPAAAPDKPTVEIISRESEPAPPPATHTPPPVETPAVPANKPWPVQIVVKAIFYNKTSPRALVNGKTVEQGDQVGGITVSKIENDRVVMEWYGQTKEFLLGNQ